jgi:DNA topoisomerase-1
VKARGRSAQAPALPADPKAHARAAGLRYAGLERLTLRRLGKPNRFRYFDAEGRPIRDADTLARIRSLAIPPAYADVRISPYPDGHLQAVGRDARGRLQYRYHPRWRSVRDENKYVHMLIFGRVLPLIRARVAADLALPGLPRNKVIAAVVRLLETTLARIGNHEYARTNQSFGLTTLRNRHVRVKGSRLTFDFRGKGGIQHHIDLHDARLARLVRRLQDLPGQDLFNYLDDAGERRGIASDDVNAYLQEISGEEITAKDFRTWAATNLAALALQELTAFDTKAMGKRNVVQAVEGVSKLLGNTPAICRKCYIHPAIFEGYLDGTLIEGLKQRATGLLNEPDSGLSAEEASVLAFLSKRLERGGASFAKAA